TYIRILNLPLPVRNSKLLTRLLILDLEAHPPGIPVRRVELEAFPVKPRVVQNGLFVPLSPEPEKLELTLARLKGVVGEENVGAAEISDTHRPDGFQIKQFGVVGNVAQKTKILKSDESCISKPKSEIVDRTAGRTPSNLQLSNFGFEMQDSSDFTISHFS